jgi:hypothetical protein
MVRFLPRLRSQFLEDTLHSTASDSCTQRRANGDETYSAANREVTYGTQG